MPNTAKAVCLIKADGTIRIHAERDLDVLVVRESDEVKEGDHREPMRLLRSVVEKSTRRDFGNACRDIIIPGDNTEIRMKPSVLEFISDL